MPKFLWRFQEDTIVVKMLPIQTLGFISRKNGRKRERERAIEDKCMSERAKEIGSY